MDISKFKTSDWLKVGGGAVFFIAGFLTWWKAEVAGFSEGANAFDWFFTGTLPWLLFTAIGVLAFLAAAGIFKLPPRVPVPLVFLAVSAFALLLVIIRFLSDGVEGDPEDFGVDISRGVGLYLALLAAIAVFAGCIIGFRESGGEFADLKDMGKLKAAFDQGPGDTPPPPPPPPSSPPPPSAPPPPPPPAS